MTLFDTLFAALRGVTANKLRAALTTLGVIIGVASVIVMLALGNGARAAVEANFRFLGSNKVQISARQKLDDGELVPAGKILSYEDGLLLPAEVELVDRVEMWVQGMGKVRHGRAVLDMTITGATVDALMSLVGANRRCADEPGRRQPASTGRLARRRAADTRGLFGAGPFLYAVGSAGRGQCVRVGLRDGAGPVRRGRCPG